MILFILFLLAHLIADFPLQTGKIVAWKKKNLLGLTVHSGIFCLVSTILLFPFLFKVWPFIAILGFAHLLIDKAKIRYTKDTLWPFLLDQFFHVGSIVGVSYSALPILKINPYQIEKFYDLNLLILLSGLIFATFATPILSYYLKSTFIKGEDKKIEIEIWGVLERFLIFLLIVLEGYFYLFIIPVLLARWRLLVRSGKPSFFNIAADPAISAITGLIVRGWM